MSAQTLKPSDLRIGAQMALKETWRTINGFEDYLISSFGRVKTKKRKIRYTHSVTGNEHFRISNERFLKIYYNNLTGYKFIQLYRNKKSFNQTIHRLVANNFIPNNNPLLVVNHKDGNKHNNIVANLEWCTNEYNHEHATKTGLKPKGSRVGSSKLNEESVYAIKHLLSIGVSHTDLSKSFKISRPAISLISEGKTWRHVEFTGE